MRRHASCSNPSQYPANQARDDNLAPEAACKILGFEGGEYASGHGSNMTLAEMPILLDDLRCFAHVSGHNVDDPVSLLDCYHAGVGLHNCTHREDVGVRCTGEREAPELTADMTVPPNHRKPVRLRGGVQRGGGDQHRGHDRARVRGDERRR